MELWIRSQTGALSQIFDIIDPTNTGEIFAYSNKRLLCLGKYKTEERALEVLDEIQRLLMPVITYTQKEPIKSDLGQGIYQIKQDVDLKIQQVSSYVYEMPKE